MTDRKRHTPAATPTHERHEQAQQMGDKEKENRGIATEIDPTTSPSNTELGQATSTADETQQTIASPTNHHARRGKRAHDQDNEAAAEEDSVHASEAFVDTSIITSAPVTPMSERFSHRRRRRSGTTPRRSSWITGSLFNWSSMSDSPGSRQKTEDDKNNSNRSSREQDSQQGSNEGRRQSFLQTIFSPILTAFLGNQGELHISDGADHTSSTSSSANNITSSSTRSMGSAGSRGGGGRNDDNNDDDDDDDSLPTKRPKRAGVASQQSRPLPASTAHFEDVSEDMVYFLRHPPPIPAQSSPDEPFLPPPSAPSDRRTLVLDLDETLVHSMLQNGGNTDLQFEIESQGKSFHVFVRFRPYAKEFLERMAKMYEVVVFTASLSVYANKLLDLIDPDGSLIEHRLFREHCDIVNGIYVKNLSRLGRPLKKCMLVDNSPQTFAYQLSNGIPIVTWRHHPDDLELKHLADFLEDLHDMNPEDVRPVIREKYQMHDLIGRATSPLGQGSPVPSDDHEVQAFDFMPALHLDDGHSDGEAADSGSAHISQDAAARTTASSPTLTVVCAATGEEVSIPSPPQQTGDAALPSRRLQAAVNLMASESELGVDDHTGAVEEDEDANKDGKACEEEEGESNERRASGAGRTEDVNETSPHRKREGSPDLDPQPAVRLPSDALVVTETKVGLEATETASALPMHSSTPAALADQRGPQNYTVTKRESIRVPVVLSPARLAKLSVAATNPSAPVSPPSGKRADAAVLLPHRRSSLLPVSTASSEDTLSEEDSVPSPSIKAFRQISRGSIRLASSAAVAPTSSLTASTTAALTRRSSRSATSPVQKLTQTHDQEHHEKQQVQQQQQDHHQQQRLRPRPRRQIPRTFSSRRRHARL